MGQTKINFGQIPDAAKNIVDALLALAFDGNLRRIFTSFGSLSIDAENRGLTDSGEGVVLDWQGLALIGGWTHNGLRFGFKFVNTQTTDYTILLAVADDVILVDASAGPVEITLAFAGAAGEGDPSAEGKTYTVVKTDSSGNAVTVKGYDVQLIDATNTQVLSSQYDSISAISNGAQWFITSDTRSSGGGSGGFPSARVVFLDLDGSNSGNSWTTAQGAYDAANALATVDDIEIIVGKGLAADFGDVILLADYNSKVRWTGLGSKESVIGNINAINLGAGNGYNVDLRLINVGIGTIDTASTDGSSPSGTITVVGENAEMLETRSGNAGSGAGGDINLTGLRLLGAFDVDYGEALAANSGSGSGNGGNMLLTDCTVVAGKLQSSSGVLSGAISLVRTRSIFVGSNSNAGANDVSLVDSYVAELVQTRGDGFGQKSGNVSMVRSKAGGVSAIRGGVPGASAPPEIVMVDSEIDGTFPDFGASLQLSQDGGNPAGNLKMTNSKITGPIICQAFGGSITSSIVTMRDSHVEGYFDKVSELSLITASTIRAPTGPCIADLDGDGLTVVDSTLESADGVTNEIDATVGRTMMAFDMRVRVGRSLNVTLSDGLDFQSLNIRIPAP